MADIRALPPRSHARHDRFAIAHALGGAPLPATVGLCPACGALHRDLVSIQAAVRHAWTPRRPRDLRLSAAEVARLRPILWRRVLALIGSSRDAFTRPLAVGLTGLGIAGLVAANISISAIGASAGAAASAAPEAAMAVGGPTGGPATGSERTEHRTGTDALVVVSSVSVAAGGGLLGLRGLAARARAMR